jgi:hypothetical protein
MAAVCLAWPSQARLSKDFTSADSLRDRLGAMGVGPVATSMTWLSYTSIGFGGAIPGFGGPNLDLEVQIRDLEVPILDLEVQVNPNPRFARPNYGFGGPSLDLELQMQNLTSKS